MRGLSVLIWTFLASFAFAQVPSLFDTVRPDATVVITKHPLGTDLVEITMLDKNYSVDRLRTQAITLGQLMGEEPRGLMVFREGMGSGGGEISFVKAKFGLLGLIDRAKGELALEQIVKVMANAPAETPVRGLSVLFAGEAVTNQTLARYVGGGVSVEGRSIAQPVAVEYRVRIDTKDPSTIVIPSKYEPKGSETPSPSEGKGPDMLVIGLILVAAVSVGALVYSLLLRPRPAGRR